MTPPTHDGVEGSVRILLTKNLSRSFSCKRFLRSQQTVGLVLGPFHCADFSLAFFFNRWSPFPELRHTWFTCTITSDEQTHPGRRPRPPAHGVTHFGPIRHEWFYLYSPKDHWSAQSLPQRQRGDAVGRLLVASVRFYTSFLYLKYNFSVNCIKAMEKPLWWGRQGTHFQVQFMSKGGL